MIDKLQKLISSLDVLYDDGWIDIFCKDGNGDGRGEGS